MELKSNTEVYFEKVSHSYWKKDGTELIGLTSLMRKHSLGADYSGISESTLKAAAAKGTEIHELLQAYDEGTLIVNEPLVEKYRDTIANMGLKHLRSEFLVSDNEIVATFIDKVYDTGIENTVDLADIKTTQKVHKRALQWQLGVNKVLIEQQCPGIKVRNCFCIWIDKASRKLKDIVPIEPVTDEEVAALLSCEKRGDIFVDAYNIPSADLVLSDEEISDVVAKSAKVEELKAAVKEIEDAIKVYYDKVRDYMVEHDLEELATEGGVFKLKKAYERTTVDSSALRRYAPEILTKCSKTTTVAASVSFKKS